MIAQNSHRKLHWPVYYVCGTHQLFIDDIIKMATMLGKSYCLYTIFQKLHFSKTHFPETPQENMTM